MTMERDGFVFYRSFDNAIKELPEDVKCGVYKAIIDYGLYGKMTEEKGIVLAIFMLVKPQIDANNRRFENGKRGAEHGVKGGRPKKHENGAETPKVTPEKHHENPTETPKEKEKEKESILKGKAVLPHSLGFSKAWEDWIAYRKSRRLPLSDLALNKHLKILGSVDEATAVLMIDTSIQSNWAGLFYPKSWKEEHKPDKRSHGSHDPTKDWTPEFWEALDFDSRYMNRPSSLSELTPEEFKEYENQMGKLS
jgi:hypothetical protein